MHIAAELVGLVIAVLAVTAVAKRLDWPAPLCLVVVGVGASYVPGVPDYHLPPEVVLVGLLPPLLYATAISSSLVDFRINRGPIALLSIGLVIFTALGVGVLAWLVIPGIPLAAGIALGAVIAPPDAVAATAVARKVGMPRKLVSLLEGESLFNDAAALVALRTAIAAIGGSVTIWQAGGDFLLAAGAGALVGLVVGFAGARLRARLADPVADTAFSFILPFVAYVPAEAVHGSGVLAVVITGLLIGHNAPRTLTGSSRLATRLNWQTVQFLLENIVFLLIGLQLRGILTEVARSDLSAGTLALVCAVVLAATILLRFAWMFAIGAASRLLGRKAWPWRYTVVLSWAGMRGVVTLAAAFVLPADTPERAVLVFAAFVVVAGTLLVQGLTLPSLVRALRLPRPDPAEDSLQEAALLDDMARAGYERLDQVRRPGDPEYVIERLRDRVRHRSNAAWEQLGTQGGAGETPSEIYRRLRLEMLAAERERFLESRDARRADDVVLRRVLSRLDIEESMLDRTRDDDNETGRELRTPAATAGNCEHLTTDYGDVRPSSADSCLDCLAEGTTWVHLRMCVVCGHVGCCDSSPRKHASAHFREGGHPVMRSFEPGETWRWCFVDKELG
ncbi:Na+/H+ antiporter [Prauserella marina]|uniref:Monovalent cation:H+ antiporter, CPA1 family n=1 Tax=Prauserella marina TaxID=530584 RepID=A0A222VMS7_9PSEU|nr:Na+/H+ antiporter [Prauserella marina]ASR35228.1 Na+/H+ antiporter [Prauserella marina]PWV85002.1 sodium/proton antiporter (CPA1 family) [Prauserella marina]SDC07140.1 monovalent cation:H+ antiporter, CPA1 family [Prauserella marina]